MGRYAQLVLGPAGSGKSTYCSQVGEHCTSVKRRVHFVNLDPAAESFEYPVSLDIRDLISVEDVQEELKLGPNGALVYAMEYFEEHLEDWFAQVFEESYGDDDYLVFDCPGQIELYSHVPAFKRFVQYLRDRGWSVCAVYLLDAQFVTDTTKFISGCMTCLSAMVQLELPHTNVLTKLDMVENKEEVENFLDVDARSLASQLNARMGPKYLRLNDAIASLIDEYSMVSFFPLDYTKEDSLQDLMAYIDNSIQYGEDEEIREQLADLEDGGG
ncbi:GPN-loop GTPase [Chloropicon primus]|uniref:GPN-loop GTPase 3 n=1 Tax=Chloropicon primus TaxID=1764295 RepID=A0A5B8MDA7_9CHLO|nr:GPN-loop GTPase [Chloropicon primus]UPQ97327.1 GPN-loop GTPase [Chloropicon primus]|eukprot:QDZ18114.1 GPN-loop GTPase [Chloropicon primus]